MKKDMEMIRVSVRGLVEFLLRHGSLESAAGASSEAVMLEGARIHRRLQKEAGDGYRAEVALRMDIPLKDPEDPEGAADPGGAEKKRDAILRLEGRADGIFRAEKDLAGGLPAGLWVVDEIKTVLGGLRGLRAPEEVHLAQARCYAWMYACGEGLERVGVRMTYYSQTTREVRYFCEELTRARLEAWFEGLIGACMPWACLRQDYLEERQETIRQMVFPFPYREGQYALAAGVYRTIARGKKLFLQAPTGTGKTMAVLFPALKAVGEDKADRIWYLTAKAVTGRAAVEALKILRQKGLRIRSVVLASRERVCPMEAADCRAAACPRADGHFDRVNEALWKLLADAADGMPLTTRRIAACAEEFRVCPYALSMDAAVFADVIIGDYNYVYHPGARLEKLLEGGSPVLLTDEAHNLLERGREMYSADLSFHEVRSFRRSVRKDCPGLWKRLGDLVRALRALDRALRDEESLREEDGLRENSLRGNSLRENSLPGNSLRENGLLGNSLRKDGLREQTGGGPEGTLPRAGSVLSRPGPGEVRILCEWTEYRDRLTRALETVRREIQWILEQEDRTGKLYRDAARKGPGAREELSGLEAGAGSAREGYTREDAAAREAAGSGAEDASAKGETAGPSRQEILDFFFSLTRFQQTLEKTDDHYIAYISGKGSAGRGAGLVLHLYCADPSGRLREAMEKTAAAVFFSATFLPIQYYKGLLGGTPEDYEMYARSSFSADQQRVVIAGDVTSRYRARNEENYRRIAERIGQIVGCRPGNYMVYFPSYLFLDKVLEAFQGICGGPADGGDGTTYEMIECVHPVFSRFPICLLPQTQRMEDRAKEAFLEAFEQPAADRHLVGFCVLGGMFGEGIDLRSDRLIGSIIVGTGIPPVEPQRELLRGYFSDTGRNGYDYAYRYPGMNKVLQAAGRVIRTEQDAGIVALLDDRFAEPANRELFPVEWGRPRAEDGAGAVSRIREFWEKEEEVCAEAPRHGGKR